MFRFLIVNSSSVWPVVIPYCHSCPPKICWISFWDIYEAVLLDAFRRTEADKNVDDSNCKIRCWTQAGRYFRSIIVSESNRTAVCRWAQSTVCRTRDGTRATRETPLDRECVAPSTSPSWVSHSPFSLSWCTRWQIWHLLRARRSQLKLFRVKQDVETGSVENFKMTHHDAIWGHSRI